VGWKRILKAGRSEQWEYRVLAVLADDHGISWTKRSDGTRVVLEPELNLLGRDGWELVAAVQMGRDFAVYTMKRLVSRAD
jgi:hypothetical protein